MYPVLLRGPLPLLAPLLFADLREIALWCDKITP